MILSKGLARRGWGKVGGTANKQALAYRRPRALKAPPAAQRPSVHGAAFAGESCIRGCYKGLGRQVDARLRGIVNWYVNYSSAYEARGRLCGRFWRRRSCWLCGGTIHKRWNVDGLDARARSAILSRMRCMLSLMLMRREHTISTIDGDRFSYGGAELPIGRSPRGA